MDTQIGLTQVMEIVQILSYTQSLVEFKNEFGSSYANLEIKTTLYCLQINYRYICTLDSLRTVQKYLCPTLVTHGIKTRLSSSHLLSRAVRLPAMTPTDLRCSKHSDGAAYVQRLRNL